MAKEQIIGLIIMKESKLFKPGSLALTHGLAKCAIRKLEGRWLMRTIRNFGQFGQLELLHPASGISKFEILVYR